MSSNATPALLAVPQRLSSWSAVERRQYLVVASSFFCTALVLAMDSRVSVASHDMFHALALFRSIIDTGSFPTTDVFAFTPTRNPVVHHEWLFGGLLYLFTEFSGWGIAGVAVLKYALLAGSAAGLARVARLRGASPSVTAGILCISLVFGWTGLGTLRAQMVTVFFVVVLINLLESYRLGHRRLAWFWPPLMVCWMNIHGGFVVGCGLYLWYTIESTWRSALSRKKPHCGGGYVFPPKVLLLPSAIAEHKWLWSAGIVSLPCLMLNPYGGDYVRYLVSALRMPRPRISEWAPLWTVGVGPLVAWCVLVGLLGYAAGAKRGSKGRELTNIAFLALAAAMTLRHARHGSLLAVLSIAYLPSYLMGSSLGLRFTVLSRRYATAVVPVVGLVAATLLWQATQRSFWKVTMPTTDAAAPFHYPAGAVQYLSDVQFSGRLMTSFTDGAYVSWQLFPACLVSMDGRYEAAYPDGAAEANADFYAAVPGWRNYLSNTDPDAVLVSKRAPIYNRLAPDRRPSGWRCCYEDASFAIFSRTARLPHLTRADLPSDAPFFSRGSAGSVSVVSQP